MNSASLSFNRLSSASYVLDTQEATYETKRNPHSTEPTFQRSRRGVKQSRGADSPGDTGSPRPALLSASRLLIAVRWISAIYK